MKSYDYEAVVYDGSVYCLGCLPKGAKKSEIEPIFADSEWDYYPVCEECGTEHDYVNLTEEGRLVVEGRQPEEPATNPPELGQAERLARKFLELLKEELGRDRYWQAAELNLTTPSNVCASHDFCDANLVMNDAWGWVVGTEMDPADESQAATWVRAWQIAKTIMASEVEARNAGYKWVREHGPDYTVPHAIQAMVLSGEARDESWHNDIAPHFVIPAQGGYEVGIWVQHPDPDQREGGGGQKRFGVEVTNPSGSMRGDGFSYETDDVFMAINYARKMAKKRWSF